MLLITSIILWIGVSTRFFAVQDDARHSNEVTDWLLTFADKDRTDLAGDKLRSAIAKEDHGFHSMLAKASEIIIENPDLFNFPAGSGNSSNEDVLQVLITQWNLHNQTSGMSKGVQNERNRISVTTPNDSASVKYWSSHPQNLYRAGWQLAVQQFPGFETVAAYFIRPLIDGLSINAP